MAANACDKQQAVEKVRQRSWKVEAEVKAEMKKFGSSLNLNLNLSLPRSLRLTSS
jgi:hypothetical protein